MNFIIYILVCTIIGCVLGEIICRLFLNDLFIYILSIFNRKRKPLGWYYYKFICELGWSLRNKTSSFGWDLYYNNLNKMIKKYSINIYGQKI